VSAPETIEIKNNKKVSVVNMSQEHPFLNSFALLPPAKDVCQECAVKHDPSAPHNQQSIVLPYTNFYGKNGRWPTWNGCHGTLLGRHKELWICQCLKNRSNYIMWCGKCDMRIVPVRCYDLEERLNDIFQSPYLAYFWMVRK